MRYQTPHFRKALSECSVSSPKESSLLYDKNPQMVRAFNCRLWIPFKITRPDLRIPISFLNPLIWPYRSLPDMVARPWEPEEATYIPDKHLLVSWAFPYQQKTWMVWVLSLSCIRLLPVLNYTTGPPSSPLTERAKGPIFTSNVATDLSARYFIW